MLYAAEVGNAPALTSAAVIVSQVGACPTAPVPVIDNSLRVVVILGARVVKVLVALAYKTANAATVFSPKPPDVTASGVLSTKAVIVYDAPGNVPASISAAVALLQFGTEPSENKAVLLAPIERRAKTLNPAA